MENISKKNVTFRGIAFGSYLKMRYLNTLCRDYLSSKTVREIRAYNTENCDGFIIYYVNSMQKVRFVLSFFSAKRGSKCGY